MTKLFFFHNKKPVIGKEAMAKLPKYRIIPPAKHPILPVCMS